MTRMFTILAAGSALALACVAAPSSADAQYYGYGPYDGAYDYTGPGYYGAPVYGPYGSADSHVYYYGNRDRRFVSPFPGSCTDRTVRSRQLQGTC